MCQTAQRVESIRLLFVLINGLLSLLVTVTKRMTVLACAGCRQDQEKKNEISLVNKAKFSEVIYLNML